MKKLIFVALLAFLTFPSAGQADLAVLYEMTPIFGHGSALKAALVEHSAWRSANNDPWEWDVYEVISGEGTGTFYARSGGHVWGDLDEYMLDGAEEHFGDTVMPHLSSNSHTITAGDTTHVNWPEWGGDAPFYWLVDYKVNVGQYETFMKAVGLYHDAVTETGHETYYYFLNFVTGGDGYNVQLVMPAQSLADFGQDEDQSMEAMLIDFYKEIGMDAIEDLFNKSIKDARSRIIARHADMSVN